MLALIFCAISQAAPIHRVSIDSGGVTRETQEYISDVLKEHSVVRDVKFGERYYRIDAPKSFRVVTGKVFFVAPGQGKESSIRFWTVPDSDAVSKFVGRLLDARGDTAVIDWGDGNRNAVISVPARQDGGGYADLYLRHEEGLLAISSSPGLRQLSLKPLVPWSRQGKASQQMRVWVPAAVPKKLRGAFLEEIQKTIWTKSQQKDDESDADYQTRRRSSNALESLVRMAIDGIDEVVEVERWPLNEDSEYEFDLRIKVRQGSELSNLLGSLRGASAISSDTSEPTLAVARFCASMPRVVREALVGLLTRGTNSDLSQELASLAQEPEVDLVVGLANTPSGLRFSSASRGSGVSTALSQWFKQGLARTQNANRPPEPAATLSGQIDGITRRVLEDKAVSTSEKNAHSFVDVAPDGGAASTLFPIANRRSVHPILDVVIDLESVRDSGSESQVRALLRDLEQLYDRWMFDSQMERFSERSRERLLRAMGLRNTFDPGEFASVLVKLSKDHVLRARLKVSATSRELRISIRASRDLHRLFIARDYFAKSRLRVGGKR